MVALVLVLLAVTLPAHASPNSRAGQDSTIASVVEEAIRNKEPTWQLAKRQTVSSRPGDDVSNPDLEEDHVTLTWRQRGREVIVAVYKFKELEKARNLFSVGTITPVMRRGYKLTKDGEELRRLVSCEGDLFKCVGFFTNRSLNGYVESYDAVFIMGRAVVIVTARKPDIVQRFALHAAEAIRAT